MPETTCLKKKGKLGQLPKTNSKSPLKKDLVVEISLEKEKPPFSVEMSLKHDVWETILTFSRSVYVQDPLSLYRALDLDVNNLRNRSVIGMVSY